MGKREFWTPKRVQEFGHVVASYNTIVRRLNKQFEGMGVRLPNEIKAIDERSPITNYEQYRRRIRQLKRLSKSVKSDAQEVVETDFGPTIKYLKRELSYAKRAVNKRREQKRSELYPEWESMSPVEKAIAKSQSNINEIVTDVNEMTGDDLDDMHHEVRWLAYDYYNNYLQAWANWHGDYEGYAEVVRIVTWFMEKHSWELEKILDGPDPEKTIDYLYLSAGEIDLEKFRKNSRRKYPSVSADLTPAETKRMNVLRFWRNQAQKYGM